MLDSRKENEQKFHDARYSAEQLRASDKYYSITSASREDYSSRLLAVKAGDRVLEFGCGPTSSVFDLVERGAIVTGIDISPVAVELAKQEAARLNLPAANFLTMDAEALDFPDGSFDIICGSGILHHLVLERSFRELVRVLAPGGRGVFFEPLGHNALINWYRNRTPDQRTVDEHPLLQDDFDLARSFFGKVEVSYYHMATLAALPVCQTKVVVPVSRALDALDKALFGVVPFLKRYSWMCVMELSNPKRS